LVLLDMLQIDNLVFNGWVTLLSIPRLSRRWRAKLVGRNGVGKSTCSS
jgi:ATPase subunit of ABC transporter with duplicated ATPase domains